MAMELCCCDLFDAHICRKCRVLYSHLVLVVWRIIDLGVSCFLFCFPSFLSDFQRLPFFCDIL